VPLRVWRRGRSRHGQHRNTVCNAESDSSATVVRIFLDCVGRVEQELKKKSAVFMNTSGVFTRSCKGRCDPPAPEAMRPGESWWGQAGSPSWPCSQPRRLAASALRLSSQINCNQIFLPATKISKVKPSASVACCQETVLGVLWTPLFRKRLWSGSSVPQLHDPSPSGKPRE